MATKKKHYNPDGTEMTQEQMRARVEMMMAAIKEGLGISQPKKSD